MIDDPNARPSLSERYGVAVSNGTSHDHLILAAGMQHEWLGTIFLRLLSEYDAVKGDLERAGQIAPQRTVQARELSRRATVAEKLKDWDAAETLKQHASEIRERTPTEVLSARSFILMGLKTLHDGKQRFGAFAIGLGVQPKRNIKPAIASCIAGQILDVWLDPTCHTCDGTGRAGSVYAGDVRRQCSTCSGSGHRRDIVGKNQTERTFARDLLAELQRRVAAAAGGMGRALAPPGAADPCSNELRHLKGRLDALRSDSAQQD